MFQTRHNGGSAKARAFRPALDGRLEERVLMSLADISKDLSYSAYLLKHPAARTAYLVHKPPQLQRAPHFNAHVRRRAGVAATQTARGGQNVEVNAGGTHYMISLSYTSNTLATNVAEGTNGQLGNTSTTDATALVSQASANYPQPIGVVRAYAMPGKKVGIIVDGSTQNTELTINPLGEQQHKGFAKSFAYGQANLGHLVNIGQITVNTGQIGDIEGYQTAVLSGPLVVSGTTAIDRIALDAIMPGASITTGGDVNTLDVLNGITLSGTSINIGRDLNLLNVGGNIDLTNGAQFNIGRNLGLVSQPPKGTGTGTNVLSLNFASVSNSIVSVTIPPVGSFIQGNLSVDPTSSFNIGTKQAGNINNTMYIEGTTTAGFTPASPPITVSTSITQGTLSRMTINGVPASLLQTQLSQFDSSEAETDKFYVTSLGGFA